jgi:hypothetical protein
MPTHIRISEARARLPELARFLAQHPAEVVLIEHRDLSERLALVTEGHLRALEEALRELRHAAGPPFQLGGSAESDRDDAEIERALQGLRAAGQMRSERKLRRLAP